MDSDEMLTESLPDIIINEADGLPNIHPNYIDFDMHTTQHKISGDDTRTLDDLIHDEDLPTSLIVTNIDTSVFHNDDAKVSSLCVVMPRFK